MRKLSPTLQFFLDQPSRGEFRERGLLEPASAPDLRRSSPHMARLPWFIARFGHSEWRREVLEAFVLQLNRLRAAGLVPVCALVGGGFLRPGDHPGDLDGLIVYRMSGKPDHGADLQQAFRAVHSGLDLRYVPADGEPEILIKMSCFFHTLYQSRDQGGSQGSLIITL